MAQRAGIRAGDRITRIDDESTQGLSIEDAAERLRGAEGEPVTLTLVAKGQNESRVIEVERDMLSVLTPEERDQLISLMEKVTAKAMTIAPPSEDDHG